MDTNELPVLNPNVDFRQVPAIHQKRTIAFVNYFITRTVSFLNTFAASCESRFMELENKLERVEASLLILESQLSSIPWLNDVDKQTELSLRESSNNNNSSSSSGGNASEIKVQLDVTEIEIEIESESKSKSMKPEPEQSTVPENSGHKVCEDTRYVKYFKMVQFGVPSAAVKLKMESEGIDSSILDNPNALIVDDSDLNKT